MEINLIINFCCQLMQYWTWLSNGHMSNIELLLCYLKCLIQTNCLMKCLHFQKKVEKLNMLWCFIYFDSNCISTYLMLRISMFYNVTAHGLQVLSRYVVFDVLAGAYQVLQLFQCDEKLYIYMVRASQLLYC